MTATTAPTYEAPAWEPAPSSARTLARERIAAIRDQLRGETA